MMSSPANNWVANVWYGKSLLVWVLLPLSLLYAAVTSARRWLFRTGMRRSVIVDKPVIVVGNISVGGTGKTPLTIWVAQNLKAIGMQPAIVSRGYRGEVGPLPVLAKASSDPAAVGDEAVLLAQRSDCPVVVHPDRVAAAEKAIEQGADVIVADDGLQHYALARNMELAVVDAERGFGNGHLLPAGPLREPVKRLDSVDKILLQRPQGSAATVLRRHSDQQPLHFSLQPVRLVRLDGSESRSLQEFSGRDVHAVAAIGNPARFFSLLEAHGLQVIAHPLPDHAPIDVRDVQFVDDNDVIMTEKDAVKCRFPEAAGCWKLVVDVEFENNDGDELLQLIAGKAGIPLGADNGDQDG